MNFIKNRILKYKYKAKQEEMQRRFNSAIKNTIGKRQKEIENNIMKNNALLDRLSK